MIAECKMLIEQVAADTAKEIVRGRRQPVTQMKYVVENKHDDSANNGIGYSDKDESGKGIVGTLRYVIS